MREDINYLKRRVEELSNEINHLNKEVNDYKYTEWVVCSSSPSARFEFDAAKDAAGGHVTARLSSREIIDGILRLKFVSKDSFYPEGLDPDTNFIRYNCTMSPLKYRECFHNA